MSGSVNKVILVGRLAADPESRAAPNGDKIVKFRLITSKSWKDKQTGERVEKPQGHNIVVYNTQAAETAHSFLTKGSNVYIEGELQNRKYESGGTEKWITEVVLERFGGQLTLMDGKPGEGNAPRQSDNRPPQKPQNSAPRNLPGRQSHAAGWGNDLDDEIPDFN